MQYSYNKDKVQASLFSLDKLIDRKQTSGSHQQGMLAALWPMSLPGAVLRRLKQDVHNFSRLEIAWNSFNVQGAKICSEIVNAKILTR